MNRSPRSSVLVRGGASALPLNKRAVAPGASPFCDLHFQTGNIFFAIPFRGTPAARPAFGFGGPFLYRVPPQITRDRDSSRKMGLLPDWRTAGRFRLSPLMKSMAWANVRAKAEVMA